MSQRSPRSIPRLQLRKILPRTRPQQLWLYGIVAVCIFLLFCTLGYPWPFGSGALTAFNLRDESNLAATWSAMLLLVAAMHAFDGWALNRPPSGSVAISWLLLSAVLVALSLDETGSFHERFPTWLSLLPIAIVFGGMFSYAIFVLFRSPEYRASSILIVVAVALFGSVALQEFIEQRFEWPGHLRSLRAVVEEGTELLAMVLLVLAAMPNTRGVLADDSESKAPAFDVVTRWRTPLVLAGILGAPAIAFVTASLDHSYAFHGVATDWLVAVFFLLATF